MPVASGVGVREYFPENQASIVDTQAPPVQNQWYTALDDTGGLRILTIMTAQWNDEAAAKNVETRVTIDTNVYVTRAALVSEASGTDYFDYLRSNELYRSTTERNAAIYTALCGHAVKIEYRMTSVPGTNQNLRCAIDYEKHEEV